MWLFLKDHSVCSNMMPQNKELKEFPKVIFLCGTLNYNNIKKYKTW